ncbi:MAG: methyltransferase domain-containing protein [Candidatus Methanomethylicia archaeon]
MAYSYSRGYTSSSNSICPWVPTSSELIENIAKIAMLRPGDVLYDLGCGDGRVIIELAKKYSIKCVGIEIRRDLVNDALKSIEKNSLKNRVKIICGDMFKIPISEATVVYMYLLTSVNERLKPKLELELKPYTRIVTLDFKIPGWKPISTLNNGRMWQSTLYLYIKGISNKYANL